MGEVADMVPQSSKVVSGIALAQPKLQISPSSLTDAGSALMLKYNNYPLSEQKQHATPV
jgi:hypothetical protein